MSERITIERVVEREPGRELIYWTVRDHATGYLRDCRSEEEANEHAAFLKARAYKHTFKILEYANRQGSRGIAALGKDGSWDVLCLTEPGHIHQFTWTQDELEFDMGDAEVLERTL